MLHHPTVDQLHQLRLTGMAKALASQAQQTDIGQLSFEERLGLLIDSAPMASAFSSSLDRDLDDVAYEVRLDGAGHLQWIDHQPTGDVVFHRDPHAGWWLRAGVTALSWLPIDWLL